MMDGIGNEVTQQIRNAIKAKLTELGAYVDDELPDYIMVMVANKKTKAQMIEDLSLFLGNSTEVFTTWLHNVLNRLQFITVVKPQTSDISDEPAKNVITSSTQNMTGETIKEINPIINPIVNPVVNPIISATVNTQEVPIQKTSKSEKLARKEKKMKLTELEESEDFLALKDEPDTDDPLVEELKEDSTITKVTKSVTNISSTKPVLKRQNIVTPIQKSSLPEKDGIKEAQKPVSVKKRLDLTSIKPKIQRPFSAVGAIVKREERFIEEEEYDPHNPSVASVVCISERRPSVPPALQANKLLLLKAVEDAHKSVISREKKTNARVEPYKPTPIRQLFARNNKQLVPIAVTNVEQLTEEENLSDFDLDATDPQEQDTRTVVSCTDKHQLKNQKPDEEDEADIEKENESQVFTKKTKLTSVDAKAKTKSDRKRKLEDIDIYENTENTPHFVVTLDGVDPSKFLMKKQRRNVVTNKISLSPDVSKYELDDLEELSTKEICQAEDVEEIIEEEMMDENVDEKIQERCRYWPACKRGDNCEYHHPTMPCKTFPNCKFADKCLYIHPNCKFDALCTRRDCPFTHASKRAFSAASVPPYFSFSKDVVIKNKIPTTKKTCRFFPNCFNSKCPYIHPKPCRYGTNCQTPNCTFNHSIIPSPAQLKWTAPKAIQSSNSH